MSITIGRNRKILLAIGIDNYPNPYILNSCVNDMNDLVNTMRLKNFSIRTVSNSNATRSEILYQLNKLVNEAVSGNTITFAFFGHGTTLDGHQGICPVDFSTSGPIMDYELINIFSNIKSGVIFDAIIGSCYSGGATSSNVQMPSSGNTAISKSYYIPSDGSAVLSNTIANNIGNHVLWAACKEDQLSWEVVSNGVYRGLYPMYLCQVLRNYPTYTRKQINDIVVPLVMSVVSTQEPRLVCNITQANKLQFT